MCGAERAAVALMVPVRIHQGLDDAPPTIADVYPPSKPIFSFYPRAADRTRSFPRGKELGYFNKQYSDGCVPARARPRCRACTLLTT